MKSDLVLAPGLALPVDYVTQSGAIMGRRGSGKTYTAKVLTEELIRSGQPVVALDILGVWWGLRASADGKTGGLPITILGGPNGDIPLEPTAGKEIAEFMVEEPGAYVLDMSHFASNAAQDRFVTDFAERLYRAKAHRPDPLHLMLDEAHNFVPQNFKGREKMLGAWEAIVRQGRARGLGVTLISQRPAVVNKNVLSQVEVLIAMQVTSTLDRKALTDWAQGWASGEQLAEFTGSLASLKVGEAWVWSPQWLEVFQRTNIRRATTFDSSATPRVGEKRIEPKRLAAVDLEVLKERMAATIERAEAEDPRKLQARVRELERALAARPVSVETLAVPVEVPVITDAQMEALISLGPSLRSIAEDWMMDLRHAISGFDAGLVQITRRKGAVRGQGPAPTTPPRRIPGLPTEVVRVDMSGADRGPIDAAGTVVKLRPGARRMLEAVAQWGTITKRQVATISDVKITGGSWSSYLSDIRRAGLVEVNGETLTITEAGRAESGVEPVPADPRAVLDYWRERFRPGAQRMLDAVVEERDLSRADLSTLSDIDINGGSFSSYLSDLKRAGLVTVDGAMVRLVDWLR